MCGLVWCRWLFSCGLDVIIPAAVDEDEACNGTEQMMLRAWVFETHYF